MGISSSSLSHVDQANLKEVDCEPANLLSFMMLSTLLKENENLIFSPYSAYVTLMMVASVCSESSRKEILDSFKLQSDLTPDDILNSIINLAKKIEKSATKTAIKSGNNIWPNSQNYNPKLFEPLMKFGIEITPVEFPQPGCDQINEKVSDITEGCIKNLLSPDNLIDCKYVITNAIYFKSEWISKFDLNETKKQTFYHFDGTTQETELMIQISDFLYYQNSDLQLLCMEYNDGFRMYIFLPKQKDITSFNHLKDSLLLNYENYIKNLQKEKVCVQIPKFKHEWDASLNDVLSNLGIKEVFVTNPNYVFISEIKQKAFIEVNEDGTVAAAATAAFADECGVMFDEEPIDFIANHPFFYSIAHKDGTILFTGAYQKI
ncbi:proteinase inhibitor I4 serpin [Histomonas meleagridis]|uniref:proteinase inhibitor I4 serpin n=1 Tax=Histomonas meleagridis TaxID=135588 RepID=UPI00355A75D2|nr:proteinase inhibitor I4 serpin [Histomonas meleagridis]KAH0806650.1 proteinase inhibitor I4 serpin [Histomonas meleagridis]